jgi:hypothetical protein
MRKWGFLMLFNNLFDSMGVVSINPNRYVVRWVMSITRFTENFVICNEEKYGQETPLHSHKGEDGSRRLSQRVDVGNSEEPTSTATG